MLITPSPKEDRTIPYPKEHFYFWSLVTTNLSFVSIALLFPGCQVNWSFLLLFCLVAKLCLTLHDLMGCCPPGSSVHMISQASILECVAISFSRGSYQPKDRIHVSCTGRKILYRWPTSEAQHHFYFYLNCFLIISY